LRETVGKRGGGVGALVSIGLPTLLCVALLAAGVAHLRLPGSAPRTQAAAFLNASAVVPVRSGPIQLYVFPSEAAPDLERVLDKAWGWAGARDAVPNLAPEELPEDFDRLSIDAKKKLFVRAVVPHVLAENRRIRALRKGLAELRQHLLAGAPPNDAELAVLARLVEDYRVEVSQDQLWRLGADAAVEALLERVDVVPPSLALSQAAIESAWGTSRFARLGNALFGQWVFAAEKGMAPLFRAEGADYSVARFPDLARAVSAYVKNLNTLWAYEDFRSLRRQMRDAGAPLDGYALAGGLRLYSERRDAYVEEIRRVMRKNRLARFDARRLTAAQEGVWRQVLAEAGASRRMRPIPLPD